MLFRSVRVTVHAEAQDLVSGHQLAIPVIAAVHHHPGEARSGAGREQPAAYQSGVGDHRLELVLYDRIASRARSTSEKS